jgi:hypothetical protein
MIRRHHIAALVALAGCKSSAEKLCQRAADRYEKCVGEKLGADLQKMVHDEATAGVAACAADDKTVAMYEQCIDKPSCDAFDDCMTAYAERTLPDSMRARPEPAQHSADDQGAAAKPANASGPPGPAIVWSTTVADDYSDNPLVWAPNHILVVGDQNGVRALQAGKELWRSGPAHEVIAIGSRLALGTEQGLRVVDAATGDEIATAVAESVYHLFANGGHVVFARGGETIFDLDVEHCSATRCKPRPIATLAEPLLGPRLAAVPGGTLVASPPSVLVLDAGGKPRLSLELASGASNRVVVAGNELAISDESGVALMSLSACAKLGAKLYLPSTAPTGDEPTPEGAKNISKRPCLAAQFAIEEIDDLTAAPGGGVALNGGGDKPSTYFVSDTTSWSTPVGGVGGVAIAGDAVYTLARDSDDQIGVVGLALHDGVRTWTTPLPKASSTAAARVAVRDGYLAARAGTDLVVLELPAVATGPTSGTSTAQRSR